MSTSALVIASDGTHPIAGQYHHWDGYEANALRRILEAWLAAPDTADAVQLLSHLLPIWEGEWWQMKEVQFELQADRTATDYQYFISTTGPGRLTVTVNSHGYERTYDGISNIVTQMLYTEREMVSHYAERVKKPEVLTDHMAELETFAEKVESEAAVRQVANFLTAGVAA